MFKIDDFILIVLIISVIYIFYKTNKIPENFSTISSNIKTAVNNQYKVDMDAIRSLASFTKTLIENNNTITLSANNTNVKDFTIERDLVVKGNILFNYKDNDNSILEMFPKYMIIAWGKPSPPKGWALCDNKYYKLVNDIVVLSNQNDPDAIKTPDLRSRSIVGLSESGVLRLQNSTKQRRNFNDMGGDERIWSLYDNNNMPPFYVLLYIIKL